MPVVTLYWDELEKLVGVDRERILEKLPMLGCDIERVEEDHLDVEFFPNRPDLYSVEGVARALRGFFGIETGIKRYQPKKGDWKIFVEESVLAIRPRIVGCIVRNLKMSDEVVRSVMQIQEDLHWTIGRNRRKMAIGVHDLSKIEFPLTYRAVKSDFSFVPLDFDETMTVKEILEKHPKGIQFRFILEGKDSYPMIVDATGSAISFPPIINAEKTRVTEKTMDLFIDVTGFDENVDKALKIISAMFYDRGGEIETVEVVYPDRTEITPDMGTREIFVERDEVVSLLGFEINDEEVVAALEKMRFGVRLGEKGFHVEVPCYRADIMHTWDIIEDIAIGYGYDRIIPEYPKTSTIGNTHKWNDVRDMVREIMIGLGFTEVITFTLRSERVQYDYMGRTAKPWEVYVPVEHPLTEEHRIIRSSILPSLIEVLSLNKHHIMPQRIFEAGDVVVARKNRLSLAGAITHSKANFSEIRSVVQAVMHELDLGWEAEESDDRAFIEGRSASIVVDGKSIGCFGEINPEVLEKFQITNPVVGFEIDLSAIFDVGDLI
ncbi:phenylalanyl-tRNA synthetase beta subunit [Archaeoglobus sulfaticallidus PM70-1]|uniref:Phenylalanine--tRNA ligase beta subunit n=1 Tax=Archaeoglobus sulfaticallidus PM70-1 TaxID=387631 RepID=N0BJE8_9EURY|nr:phenylalanine--tRNA ligase subunit beta [Archaeoglobus sulfaticallidus]AGK60591.1 phenylalanyl-tRNA synthetase beta subunit [Archaeoglobus sulfaticallidus PM70-1]